MELHFSLFKKYLFKRTCPTKYKACFLKVRQNQNLTKNREFFELGVRRSIVTQVSQSLNSKLIIY